MALMLDSVIESKLILTTSNIKVLSDKLFGSCEMIFTGKIADSNGNV